MLPPPSTIAVPMATAIATIAHTVDSRPVLIPERTVVAGPVRDETDDDGAEHLPALVVVVVADVEERHRERAEHRQDARGGEAAVDRRHRRTVTGRGPHREHADDRGEHPDRACG